MEIQSLCILILVSSCLTLNITEIKLVSGRKTEGQVTKGQEIVYYFDLEESNIPSREALASSNRPVRKNAIVTPRITTWFENSNLENKEDKIQFNLRYNGRSTEWSLPTHSFYSNRYDKLLCPLIDEGNSREVQISVSTASTSSLSFSLAVEIQDDLTIPVLGETRISPIINSTSPVFYFVQTKTTQSDFLLIHVESSSPQCAVVSAQPFQCPLTEEYGDLKLRTGVIWQTMLKNSNFVIQKSNYMEGFWLVLQVLPEDWTSPCYSQKDDKTAIMQLKTFKIRIETEPTVSEQILYTTVVCLAMCLTVGVITVISGLYRGSQGKKKWVVQGMRREESVTVIQVDLDTGNTMVDSANERKHSRNVAHCVSQLAVKTMDRRNRHRAKMMFQSSDMYTWLVLVMGVFYAIPALQLVLNYQQELYITGNQDLCYYNFQCAIPVQQLNLTDFNHFFSNIGYIAFGIMFLIIVRYKSIHYRPVGVIHTENADFEISRGIPHHFGIFYAMGFALILEGVLSGCYHVCPTNQNFQFDTTFMYIMALIMTIKVFQFRHPDLTANAYKVFSLVALIMFLEVMGIFYGNTFFWAITLSVYGVIIFLASFALYFSHAIEKEGDELLEEATSPVWKLNARTLIRIVKLIWPTIKCGEIKWDSAWGENYKINKVVLIVILQVINWTFLLYGVFKTPGISSYLLYIFVSNLLVYCFYYITMKVIHKEKITIQPIIYFIFAQLFSFSGFYFFVNSPVDSNSTPAESRNSNNDCRVLQFYDNHDIWHFLSSAGLFCFYMLLLTLDEGLEEEETSNIAIF